MLRRLPRVLLAVAILGGYATAVVLGLGRLQLDTGVSSVLAAHDQAVTAIDAKASAFGGDPIVVLMESKAARSLLVDANQLPRLARLEGQLSQLPDVAAVYGPGTVVNQIATGARNMLAEIAGRRAVLASLVRTRAREHGMPKAQTAALVKRATAAFDKRYGGLLAEGMPAGLPTVYNPSFVQAAIFGPDGTPKQQWRFVVPTDHSVAIIVRPRQDMDEAATHALVLRVRTLVGAAGIHTSRVTISGLPVVSDALADAIRSGAPWLALFALVGSGLVLVLVPGNGRRRDRLLPVAVMAGSGLAILAGLGWWGRPVSVGVLALFPILMGVGADFPMYLAQGLHRGRVLTSAVASAAAAGALAVSPMPMVRQLGLTLAGGVVLVVLLGLALRRLGWLPTSTTMVGAPAPVTRSARRGMLVLSLVAVAVAAIGWAVLPRIPVNADPEHLAAGLPALSDAEHVESVMGASSELTIVMRGTNVLSDADLAWERKATDAVVSRYGDRVQAVLSPTDLLGFLGDDPKTSQTSAAMDLVPSYLTSAVVTSDRAEGLMIFGTTLQDVGHESSLLDGIDSVLPPTPKDMSVQLVGTPVVAAEAYDEISRDRYLTSGLGILAAGLVLLVGLRRPGDAARAVLAGALATGWGLAILWAVGGSLTPLTVALGALTTVVGCEFLVMLTDRGGLAPRLARRAVLAACLNSTVAYLALATSRIAMLRDFGLVMAITVVLALVAATFVTQLGRVRIPARHAVPLLLAREEPS